MASRFRIVLLFLLVCCAVVAQAEVVVLRTGKEIQGTILLQNDDVVIIKDATGARFQYARADILDIRIEQPTKDLAVEQGNATAGISTGKKVSVIVELAGGGSFIPKDSIGGTFSANLLIGTHNLLRQRIFLGAGVGYIGEFIGNRQYQFLPLMLAARIPLLQQQHTPIVGFSLGYGFALRKDYKGGLYAGFNIGYCYHINSNYSVYVGADLQLQQARIQTIETIITEEEIPDTNPVRYNEEMHLFRNTAGRSLLNAGIRVGFFF